MDSPKQDVSAKLTPEQRTRVKRMREMLLESIRKLHYDSPRKWIEVTVEREEMNFQIAWKIKTSVVGMHEIAVEVRVSMVDYEPCEENLTDAILWKGIGSGNTSMVVPPGHCIYCCIGCTKVGIPVGPNNIDSVVFMLATPLTADEFDLLVKAKRSEDDFTEEIDDFLEERESMEAKLLDGIEKIKAKGLPPESEAEQIAELKDFAATLRAQRGK